MKGVRCSWVDMQKIRQQLAVADKGKDVQRVRCVDKSTISTWRNCVDVLDATDGEVDLSQLEHFQPTHAREIARHYRKTAGRDPAKWSDDVKDDIIAWVETCEEGRLTVQALREALQLDVEPEVTSGDSVVAHDLQEYKMGS